jgi:hypothetical protein
MNTLAHIPNKTVTSGYRAIKDGSRYNSYFPPPDERDRVIIKDGEVTDTVELMEKVVWKYLDDTKRIAPLLMRLRYFSLNQLPPSGDHRSEAEVIP